jgi:pimeloyl-ACP methyl ester carboxylesterase
VPDTVPSRIALKRISTNGIETTVAVAGSGPAVLLLHGFPHTWEVWRSVIGPLAERHRVIAPDLRGLGGATRAEDGYDAGTLAVDAAGVLDALGESVADVVAIDLGAPVAFLMAMRWPGRVRRLVVMESLLGRLPGAEEFLAGGPPWWFGFHAVPGLAESVVVGQEGQYLDWFLGSGVRRGVPEAIRDAFVRAYSGSESLRCAFEHYRALPESARLIAEAAEGGRLGMPVMAIGAHPVGRALEKQVRAVADDLVGHVVEDCGHIIPLDRPEELVALVTPFLR